MKNYTVLDAFEDLDNLNLCEQLIRGEETWQKLWWFSSEYQFRDFLKAKAALGGHQGYRIIVGQGTYAIADAHDLNHDGIEELLGDKVLPIGEELATIGVPTVMDFEDNNFELEQEYEWYIEGIWPWTPAPPEGMSYAEFVRYETSKYKKTLTAVCDGFEVNLYNYEGITDENFKQTELGKALGPLFKYIKK